MRLAMKRELTPLQQRVFVLFKKPNVDIPIRELFDAAYPLYCDWSEPGEHRPYPSIRSMQMGLGPLFSRINDKLTRGKIEPGHLKQTYRLTFTQQKD